LWTCTNQAIEQRHLYSNFTVSYFVKSAFQKWKLMLPYVNFCSLYYFGFGNYRISY